MKPLVIYGGRFQPPHKGHLASFNELCKKFGAANVYMASADKPPGPKDPFTWDEKRSIAVQMGVPSDHFVKVVNVYNAEAIQQAVPYNPDDTVLILALSKKDGDRLISKTVDKEGYALKKSGERAAIQWLRKDAKPVDQGHIYCYATKTETFTVAGKKVSSASEIRDMYATGTSKLRKQILADLYGDKLTPKIAKLFDTRLDAVTTESLLREFEEFLGRFIL